MTQPSHTRLVFTGAIHSTEPIRYIRVRDEANDVVRLSSDAHTLWFRFVNHGYIDGVDFRTDCAKTVGFSLQAAGAEVAPSHIYVSYRGVHPADDPFAISRS